MFVTATTLALCAMCQTDGGEVRPEQFLRLMESFYSSVEDAAFVFEGYASKLGSISDQSKNDDKRARFQGIYTIRSDGATLLEVYSRKNADDPSAAYNKSAILNHRMEMITKPLDARAKADIRKQDAVPGSLNGNHSPESFVFHWYFWTLNNLEGMGYRFLGWEDVLNNKCLKVQLNKVRGSKVENQPTVIFWIDTNRGGHPLKVEWYRKGKLSIRIDDIQLEKYADGDARELWFPVKCVASGFEWNGIFYNEPVYQETNYVVQGSLRINQRLPDSVFTVKNTRETVDETLGRRIRKDSDYQPTKKIIRSDPSSVTSRLDQHLAEAEKQSTVLLASTRDSGWIPSGAIMTQVLLCAIGISALVLAAILKRRGA